jgi:crotonobetainyl-CoA:carnitine CoA-transferase CaiB-like acyl-CoA transferase
VPDNTSSADDPARDGGPAATPARAASPLKRRDYAPQASGPLRGVRIVDMSRLFAGNVMTQILGDFGAEVIKVEPPAGDTLRAWQTKGVSTHWKVYGRNKKSLCLDLRKQAAIEILLELATTADVFIESFRPGVLEQMGLGSEVLHARNPRLVVVRISGWGQSGPYHQRPGFGTLIEGMAGFAAINGFEDREPVLPPMYLADGMAGLFGVSSVMIALRETEHNGGAGQVIDLPLLDPLLAMLGPQAANHRLTGTLRKRTGSRSTNAAPRNAYRTKDGRYVSLSGSTQKMAERTLCAVGRPDLIDDPRFRTNADRVRHAAELDAIIGAFIAQHTQEEAVAIFDRAQVTAGPIYDVSQIMVDPHIVERELLTDYPDEEMGLLPMHHVVPRLLGTPGSIRLPAPWLGQHNREILGTLGFEGKAYQALLDAGIARESPTLPPCEPE